jgi:DNA-binding NtrC family response regulator
MSKSVLIVDDSEDLVESLATALELCLDARVVKATSLAEVQAQRDAALSCDLAIVDINLGPEVPSGLDVHRWLTESSFKGRIVFFTGHARNHPLVKQALRISGVKTYDKPMPVAAILALVEAA